MAENEEYDAEVDTGDDLDQPDPPAEAQVDEFYEPSDEPDPFYDPDQPGYDDDVGAPVPGYDD
jgi:hypothetical protein